MTAIAASSRCIPTSSSASSTTASRTCSSEFKDARGFVLDTDLAADELAEVIAPLQGLRRGGDRQAVPAGCQRAAVGRDRRGIPVVDVGARHHLSPAARHPGGLGHGGQRAGDGVRQYGRDLGHRRRLHPQSLDGRAARSMASSWSMPRARMSSPASARRRTSARRRGSRRSRMRPRSSG